MGLDVGPRFRSGASIAFACAFGALVAAPGIAQAAPPSDIDVLFGFPPASTSTDAGDVVPYTVSFTATEGLNDDVGRAIVISATDPAGEADGTVFPPQSSLGYLLSVNDGPQAPVSGEIELSDGGQTVTIPTAGTLIDAAPGDTVRVGIGYFSGGVQNPPAPCTCRLAVAIQAPPPEDPEEPPPSLEYGVSAAYEVEEGPGDLMVEDGDDQATTVGTAFDTTLKAKLVDGLGDPVAGQTVTFEAPEDGPSGTFAGGTDDGRTFVAETDAEGIATASVLTANGTVGNWEVTATSSVAEVNDVTFSLENEVGPATNVSLEVNPNAISGNGVSTTTATATVEDALGNPVPGLLQAITFESTGTQAITNRQELGGGVYRATVRSTPAPGLFTITATVDNDTDPSDSDVLLQTLDTTAPAAKIVQKPGKKVRNAKVKFGFDSNSADTDFFECKLDNKAWKTCKSPKSYRVKRGKHTFRVRATDMAGNTGPADSFKFTRVKKRN